MSLPANPLANYRSYSYYHVLAICDSTETADNLSVLSDDEQWRHPTSDEISEVGTFSLYGKYSPREIKLANKPAELKGKYCVLVDGASDADVSITNLQYVGTTTAAATEYDRGTSIALEGMIQFSEPRGISFLDTIVLACRALNIDAAQAVYVVKTFFVGHAHDVVTQDDFPQQIVTVEPLKCMATDMTGSFTQNGGEYTMQFACLQHGIARLPQYSKSAESFSIRAGDTLLETVAQLQDKINKNYDKLYNCVTSSLSTSGTNTNAKSLVNRVRKVKYVIELDKQYQTDDYTVGNQTSSQKDSPDCASPGQLAVPAGLSIEDAIHLMMAKCSKVEQERGAQDQPNQEPVERFSYKVDVSFESSLVPPNEENPTQYVVTYTIKRFIEPSTINVSKSLKDKLDNINYVERNLITFDYMYTGNNTDILDMDITMNQGFAYLQIGTMSLSTKEQNSFVSNKQTRVGASDVDRYTNTAPVPVFFSTDVQSPLFKNVQNTGNGTQAAYTMARHASIEALETSVVITGNPLLLNSINRASGRTITPPSENGALLDFASYPSLAKINIRMPSNNDDIALLSSQIGKDGAADYAKEFWFQGYYYIIGIENLFQDGEFRQRLELLGLPERNFLPQGLTSAKSNLASRVDACYDGNGIESTPKAKHTIPAAPPATPPNHPQHTTDNVKSLVDGREYTVDDVRGYTANAPQDLKLAIANAASVKGVSPVLLAQIAALEAKNFSVTSVNPEPGQSASGAFQFISDTWMGFVSQGKIPGIAPTTPRSEALPLRFNAQYAALAAGQYVTENRRALKSGGVRDYESSTNLYLSHVIDGSRAAKVISAVEQGRGDTPVYEILGTKYTRQFTGPNHLEYEITAKELQAWSANRVARTLNTTKVAQTPSTTSTKKAVVTEAQQIATIKAGKTGTQQISNVVSKDLLNTPYYTSGEAKEAEEARIAFIASIKPHTGRSVHETPAKFSKRFNEEMDKYDKQHAGDAQRYNAEVKRNQDQSNALALARKKQAREDFRKELSEPKAGRGAHTLTTEEIRAGLQKYDREVEAKEQMQSKRKKCGS